MNASDMQQDLDSSDKNGECMEARLTIESVVMDKPAATVDSGKEGSRGVSSEKCIPSPTRLDGSLERNCIKEQNDTPTIPGVKTQRGQDEKLHGRGSCLEAQSADESLSQKTRLSAFEIAETVFGLYRGTSKKKGHVLDTTFTGQLLESWEKYPYPSLPLASEAQADEEDSFSVHNLSQQTRWEVERTCSNDCISGQGNKDLCLTAKSAQQGKVSLASQVDFLCSPVMGGTKTDKLKCKEDIRKLCTNKNIETGATIKPCFVLLENIGHKIKAKDECCLIQPDVKELPQKTQKKTTVIKGLKVMLCDIVKKRNIEYSKKPLQLQNAEAVLDDAKENQKENSLKPNSSASILCSETDKGQTNEDDDGKKIESETSSTDNSNFCDANIFAKLSKYVNSFMDLGQVQDCVKGKGGLQGDSVLIPEKTQSTFFTEGKSPKVSLTSTDAPFALPNEANLCEAACDSDSCFVSLRTEDDLGLDIKDTVPSKTQIKMPIKPCPIIENSLTEESIQKQVDVGEVEKWNQSNPAFKNLKGGDCWFLMEIDEVVAMTGPVCVRDGLPRERDCSDVPFSPDVGRPQLEIESYPDDAANMKYGIKTRTMEEESLQPHQSHGELCGQTVKLLGIPSDNDERPNLGRLINLDDASNDEASQGKHAGPSKNRRRERKTYPASSIQHKPSSLGESRAKRKVNREEPPANHLLLSESQSRTKVVDALRKTLQKRLDESPDLNVQEGAVLKVAKRVERALFELFCCVDQHYKNKYRSLLFNLKSPDNKLLFRRVILGDIAPKRLVQMTSLEMAPKQLAEWRASENKRVLEVIEREEQEAARICPTKFTHKGIVEIHREVDEDLALQETLESLPLDSSCEDPVASGRNSSDKDSHHPSKSAFSASTEEMVVRIFKPRHFELRRKKSAPYSPDSLCLDGEGRPLPEDSIPEKHPEKLSRSTVVWEGLIQMFSLKQFAAKAFPVSGSISNRSKALPLLLQSKGCILPEDVWVYLDSLWPANSKAMGIVQFCPSMTRDSIAYNMLYSYLNNKQRYGIVGVKQLEVYMVPLAAFQPLPAKLHPLGGPGLDLCHPSLLLGLILPKRTPTSILVTSLSPLPKTKKKRVSFKDSTETKHSDPPFRLPTDTSLTHPPSQPLPMPGPENESPQGPLAIGDLETFPEALAGAMCPSLHCEDTVDGTNPSPLVNLQSLSGSPWIEGQTWGTLEAQPYQTMNPGQFGMASNPPYSWPSFGLPSSSECLYPEQHGADEASVFEGLLSSNQLCSEAAPSYIEMTPMPWFHQVPCTTSLADAPSSIIEETLALYQRVAQLQPNLQSQPLVSGAVGFPPAPQEGSSAMSQVATGLELPPDQQDNGMFAQLQLLLSALGGQAQPPSAT